MIIHIVLMIPISIAKLKILISIKLNKNKEDIHKLNGKQTLKDIIVIIRN